MKNIMGLDVPEWVIGLQLTYQEAANRLDNLIDSEYQAKVWNYTKEETIPPNLDPALALTSPENVYKYKGLDFGLALCDGFTLDFVLFQTFLKYSDPLFQGDSKVMSDIDLVPIADPSNEEIVTSRYDDERLY